MATIRAASFLGLSVQGRELHHEVPPAGDGPRDPRRHHPGSGGGQVREVQSLQRRHQEEARTLHKDGEEQQGQEGAGGGQPVLV